MTSQVAMNLFIGAAFDEPVTLEHAPEDGEANGAPIDMTGWALQFALIDDSGVAVLEAGTADDTIVIDDAENGAFHFAIPSSATADLEPGRYNLALVPVYGGDVRTPLMVGRAEVRAMAEVTS